MEAWETVLIGGVFVGMLVVFVGGIAVALRPPKNQK